MKETQRQLNHFVNPEKITPVFNTTAAHVWSLDEGPCPCGKCAVKNASKKCCDINNCGYDQSGDMFRKIYGNKLKPKTKAIENYYWIDQWKYINGNNDKDKSDHSHLM